MLLLLLLGSPHILSLDLGGCKHLVTDSALLALAHACPDLRSLNLRFCDQVSRRTLWLAPMDTDMDMHCYVLPVFALWSSRILAYAHDIACFESASR